jgi:hypothetical protein
VELGEVRVGDEGSPNNVAEDGVAEESGIDDTNGEAVDAVAEVVKDPTDDTGDGGDVKLDGGENNEERGGIGAATVKTGPRSDDETE